MSRFYNVKMEVPTTVLTGRGGAVELRLGRVAVCAAGVEGCAVAVEDCALL